MKTINRAEKQKRWKKVFVNVKETGKQKSEAKPYNTSKASQNPEQKRRLRQKVSNRVGFSMGLRISVSYVQMLIDAFLSCLILIVIIYIVFHSVLLAMDVRGIVDDMYATDNLSNTIYDIVVQKDTEISLSHLPGENIINTFGSFNNPHQRIPIWFYRRDNSVYVMFRCFLYTDNANFELNIFKDITTTLLEMAVLFGFTVILCIIVMLMVYFRGHSITKNVLYPIAEMTKITKAIKGQNLNLRLNVSNAKDELKELVITFNEMMDRIETAYNKQNQFASDASHELRTPISVIQGYARMLERWGKEDPEVLSESIEAIGKEADNMKELVDKLLFIARNDKDTLNLTKERFSLSEMMDELVKETRMVNNNQIIDSSIEQDIEITGDRNRIKQAMRIFVDNAQKYTKTGEKIEINLKKEKDTAIMSVKDSGCGIESKDLHSIFDRFYRADQSRDRNKGGHGLGLSIAKIIVLRHGGKISVKSKLGEGSVFSIILKLEQTE